MRFNVIDLPGRVKLPARSFCSIISLLLMCCSSAVIKKVKTTLQPFLRFSPTVPLRCLDRAHICVRFRLCRRAGRPARYGSRGSLRSIGRRPRQRKRRQPPTLKLRLPGESSSTGRDLCLELHAADLSARSSLLYGLDPGNESVRSELPKEVAALIE